MIMMAACAVLGAVLGLYAKPRWLGVAIAVAWSPASLAWSASLIGLIDDQPNRERLIGQLQAIFGETWLDAAWTRRRRP
jgi:hypothetical protein